MWGVGVRPGMPSLAKMTKSAPVLGVQVTVRELPRDSVVGRGEGCTELVCGPATTPAEGKMIGTFRFPSNEKRSCCPGFQSNPARKSGWYCPSDEGVIVTC